MATTASPTDRTRIRRVASNASYERTTLNAVIDDAYLCHIAFADAKGSHCIPTACWRQGEHLYVHGSNGGRLVGVLEAQNQVCVTITHLDGLVLARSAFNHSMNYRSAMIYGVFERVEEDAARRESMALFMDKIAPGRQAHVRPGSDKEFAATTILRIGLDEAACKVRTGGPNDDATDLQVAAWAGTLPMRVQRLPAIVDEDCNVAEPDYVGNWSRE